MGLMKRILLEYLPAWLLIFIFGAIVIHAPLIVATGAAVPEIALGVKAWKEVMMVAAAILLVIAITDRKQWRDLFTDKLMWLIGGYVLLHLLLLAIFPLSPAAHIAGLMIDLRFVAYFVLVYVFLNMYPSHRPSFLKVGAIGAAIVVGFALLQMLLPPDFLKYLGYSEATISPYLTVDKNSDYVRLQSTLRGPNPLGAYAMVVFAGVLTYGLAHIRRLKSWKEMIAIGAFAIAALVAVWFSYSRSALIGLIVAVAIVAWRWRHKATMRLRLIIISSMIVVGGVAIWLVQGTDFWHNVVLHDNPTTGAAVTSNEGHAESLADGLRRMAVQPLGAGVGSTGSASLIGGEPLVIENQYLFIAHESGWIGLALFVVIFGIILWRLWRRRDEWLTLATVASGLGLAAIGLVQPVWVDDTVSIIWWGLAAIVLSTKGVRRGRTKTHKKAARAT